MKVTVDAPANTVPVAEAGNSQAALSGMMVILDGGGSSDVDGQDLGYLWTQISGPSVVLSDATSIRPTFTAPLLDIGDEAASLIFSLVVNDGFESSLADEVTVTVNAPANSLPLSDAGDNQTVPSGVEVTLNAVGSSDADGQDLGYLWTQISGPSVVLSDATSIRPTFTAPLLDIGDEAVSLIFSLVVNDGFESSLADEVTVTVHAPANSRPLSDAGDNQSVSSGSPVILDGRGSSDADGQDLGYLWTQISGPSVVLSDATSIRPTFTAPLLDIGDEAASLIFSLVVNDGFESSLADEVTVTVNAPANSRPLSDAGDNQSVSSGSSVILDGGSSSDADGQDLGYLWTQISGPSVVLSDATSIRPTFTAPLLDIGDEVASLIFSLVVDDGIDSSLADVVVVTVQPPGVVAPVADAGVHQLVTSGSLVSLDGRGSQATGSGSNLVSYRWTQVSGMSVTLTDVNQVEPQFVAPMLSVGSASEELVFALVVHDGVSDSLPAMVKVTVDAPANSRPLSDAGHNQSVSSGSSVILDGGGSSDADGQDLGYLWMQISGPSVVLSDATSIRPTFTAPLLDIGDEAASLIFSLVVNDGFESSLADEVTVTVNAPANSRPLSDAGDNQ